MKNNLSPNRDDIKSHLNSLFSGSEDGLIEIAYTPPQNGAVNKAEFFNVNNIDAAVDFVERINSIEGVNTYVGAALRKPDTAPFMRSNSDDYYKSFYAWADLDDADAARTAKEKYKDLPPSFVVVTGRHPDLRAQVWWKLSDPEQDKAKLKTTLSHVCSALNGDKAVVDPARVMRIGGSIAWPKKDGRKPELTEFIIPSSKTNTISIDDLTSHYPLVDSPVDMHASASGAVGLFSSPKSKLFHDNKEWSIEDIEGLLEYIHPDNEYLGWVKIGMALKDYGVSFDVWDRWSQTGAKYDAKIMRSKWESFKGSGTTIGSLVYQAKQGGWKPNVITQIIEKKIIKNESVNYNAETGETEDQPKQVEKSNKFFYINAPDIDIDLEVNDFVQGLLTENALSVVYGESNCGKTFFMSDLAFHVAQGKEWRGKRVEKGNVLYLSLEGSRGIKNRIAAYKSENNVNLDGFLMMPCQVDFIQSDEDIPELVSLILSANSIFDNNIKLIVVDTLARALGGGDENSGQDMGTLVKHADLIRQHTNAHICFIHHSGKDKARGARGHSSLRAAVDTEIEISRNEGDDFSNIKIAKQRDLEREEDLQFKLKRIVLGVNRHNEEVSSCIVEPYDLQADAQEKLKTKQVSGKTKAAFDALREAIMEKGFKGVGSNMPNCRVVTIDIFKEYLQRRGVLSENQRSAYTQYDRVSQKLIDEKLINIRDKYVWIAEEVNVV